MYAATEKQRRDEVVFTAWQTITNAEGQPGSGGRIQALEFLNASPGANWRRQAICLWICTWPAENLNGINLGVTPLENLPPDTQLDASEDEAATEPRTPGVYLRRIQLPDASLVSANLQDADLWDANLQGAFLVIANLQNADLWFANLQGAVLWDANLQNAGLRFANLQNADLGSANLQNANLGSANLQNANLRQANLQDAILLATDLRGTHNLRSQQLTGEASPYLCNVALPEALTNIDPNRDCETLPQLIAERYSMPLEGAQQWVQEDMKKQWD
ncbi:MAG: pentapeptide repeat-containing protein [Cyanobacteria bacterium P01_D01_bin.115]